MIMTVQKFLDNLCDILLARYLCVISELLIGVKVASVPPVKEVQDVVAYL